MNLRQTIALTTLMMSDISANKTLEKKNPKGHKRQTSIPSYIRPKGNCKAPHLKCPKATNPTTRPTDNYYTTNDDGGNQ